MSNVTILAVMALGSLAGGLGVLLGIGGGVFLVPLLVLLLGLPFRTAVGISLSAVVATSTVVSAGMTGRRLINLRLGMLLEVATVIGGLAGGLTAQALPERALHVIFGLVTATIAAVMLTRLNRRNVILDLTIDPGRLGGRFYEEESGGEVTYRVRRLGLGVAGSFAAGNLSSLLGIGGGVVKVPLLNAACGVPMRAAAATSAFMIGVTAVAALPIYYIRGDVVPQLAAAGVLGVLLGSRAGFWIGGRSRAKWLKLLMAVLLVIVSALMFATASAQGGGGS